MTLWNFFRKPYVKVAEQNSRRNSGGVGLREIFALHFKQSVCLFATSIHYSSLSLAVFLLWIAEEAKISSWRLHVGKLEEMLKCELQLTCCFSLTPSTGSVRCLCRCSTDEAMLTYRIKAVSCDTTDIQLWCLYATLTKISALTSLNSLGIN